MIDVQKYIVDGVVAREKIALDIKYRTISKQDIQVLIRNPEINKSFFGHGYEDKIPSHKWDKLYLEKLSYAVVSEVFNGEYLLYLNDVAEKVSKDVGIIEKLKKRHYLILGFFGILVVVIVAFVICKVTR